MRAVHVDGFTAAQEAENQRRADQIEEAYELRVIEGQVHRVTLDADGCEVVRLHGAHYGNCSVCEAPLHRGSGGVCGRCQDRPGFWNEGEDER